MFKVIILPRAQKQIIKEADWYYDKSPKSEGRFLNSIDTAIDILSINPFFAIRYKNVRAYVLNNFPYIIFFHVEESKRVVKIISIVHTSKKPSKTRMKGE